MAQKIRWSPRAVEDLESIGNYIARDSKLYASLFIQNILTIIRHIPDFPTSGRIVPEYNMKEIREKIYGNYRIGIGYNQKQSKLWPSITAQEFSLSNSNSNA